jgi:phospholipid/cholesterol/gamma-HCH transport system permease protein
VWDGVLRAATRARGRGLRLDVTSVEAFDMAGAALLLTAEGAHGTPIELTGVSPHATAVLTRARRAGLARGAHRHAPAEVPGGVSGQVPGHTEPPAPAPTDRQPEAQTGQQPQGQPETQPQQQPPPEQKAPQAVFPALTAGLEVLANGVAFVGEAVVAVLRLPSHLRMLRMGDLLREADEAGVQALPLVLLLGFLMGMILAFQSAVPLRRFGADLLVANLVTVSLVRELGPLLSAVILAGRTGSAFAAEIGTMKVNREVDALITMGVDPMTMLVLPRLIAVMLVLPALALSLDIAGLLGMATVMRGFGFPMAAILHQVQTAASVADLFGGLFKAVCFGGAIAAIGCRAGLSTGNGPRAVGLSATAAVVGGIVATIALDGVLALIFYRLNL